MNSNGLYSVGVSMRLALLVALIAAPVTSQRSEMTKPCAPREVMGNVYFVGTANLGAYVVTTPEGHVLVNTDFEATVPAIRAGVEKLGLKLGRNLRGNVDA